MAHTLPMDDPRFCPSHMLLRAMHRTLLVCPVLGLSHEFEQKCVRTRKTCLLLDTLPSDTADDVYTWKAHGSRIVTIMKTGPTTTVVWDQVSHS